MYYNNDWTYPFSHWWSAAVVIFEWAIEKISFKYCEWFESLLIPSNGAKKQKPLLLVLCLSVSWHSWGEMISFQITQNDWLLSPGHSLYMSNYIPGGDTLEQCHTTCKHCLGTQLNVCNFFTTRMLVKDITVGKYEPFCYWGSYNLNVSFHDTLIQNIVLELPKGYYSQYI